MRADTRAIEAGASVLLASDFRGSDLCQNTKNKLSQHPPPFYEHVPKHRVFF